MYLETPLFPQVLASNRNRLQFPKTFIIITNRDNEKLTLFLDHVDLHDVDINKTFPECKPVTINSVSLYYQCAFKLVKYWAVPTEFMDFWPVCRLLSTWVS